MQKNNHLFFLILVLFVKTSVFSQQSSCPNSDFELGTFSGWQAQTGSCCPINTSNSAIIYGRHTIMSGTGTDPNTCGNVTVVSPGGLYSARLGNDLTGSEAEKLTYSLTVSPSNALFIYKYAVVLEDPVHDAADQPRFQIRVLNSSGVLIDPICGAYTVVSGSSIPGFQTCNDVIRYKNWTTVGLNLSSYIGQTITIEFATGDCTLGAHFGYAYVDAFCSPLQISSTYCTGSFAAVLSAPIGFTYLWNTGETTQTINVNNPSAGLSYNCLLTSVTGCTVNISTILSLFDPVADFSITNTCYDNAIFANTTSLPSGTILDSFLWDFGDGTTSTLENPTHTYANPGTYNVTFTISNALGCSDNVTYPVTVYKSPTAQISYSQPAFCTSTTSPQTVSLTGTYLFSGGTFSAPIGLSIDSATGSIVPSTSTPGNYTVSYTIPTSNGCSVPPVTTIVAITQLPSATISYSSPYCKDITVPQAVSINGTFAYLGGTFSSTAGLIINSSTGAITPNISNPGTYLVTYTIPATGGCPTVPVNDTVVITPLPNPLLTNGDICFDSQGNLARNYIFNSGLSSALYNFKWYFNGTLIVGATNSFYTATAIGNYSVIATSIATGCFSSQVFATVVSAQMASDFIVNIEDNFTDNNVITVLVQGGSGPFYFQLDNGTFQTSNVFNQIPQGIHTITITDDTNCTVISKEIIVMGYPKFFTPNGDGLNEFWNIYYFNNLPESQIYIFDRYGKFLKQISSIGIGWDGTYQGALMPATDYWFVVKYLNNNLRGEPILEEFKSHFSLKR
jgi:gliding motility-associated-like protein